MKIEIKKKLFELIYFENKQIINEYKLNENCILNKTIFVKKNNENI